MKKPKSKAENQVREAVKYAALRSDLIAEYNEARPNGPQSLICYAPFKSMRFSMSGAILACCYNREYALGHYPENTIKETWTGKKARKLREHLSQNDLSLGCQSCEKSILNQTYATTDAAFFDYTPDQVNNDYPVRMEFELDNTCNLECIMCNGELSSSIRKNREYRPAWSNMYDSSFVDQLEEFIPYLKQAYFTGGEPFLIDLYYEIWDRMIDINPEINITVVTNATTLNNKVKNLLRRGNFHIVVSIDSLEENTYKSIRPNSNFERLVDNFQYLQEYCKTNDRWLTLNVCVMRQNWREIPSILKYCNQHSISIYLIKVLFPPYAALWNLESQELHEIEIYLSSHKFDDHGEVQKDNIKRHDALTKQVSHWHLNALKREAQQPRTEDTITDLKESFRQQITDYVYGNLKDSNTEQERKLDKYRQIGEEMFGTINNQRELRNSLLYFNDLPIERTIGEMEFQSIEALQTRVKQAGLEGAYK